MLRRAHRRQQDCTASTNSADNRKSRGDGDDHVQYIPVLSREFGSVEIETRDDTGRPVPKVGR